MGADGGREKTRKGEKGRTVWVMVMSENKSKNKRGR
jgi:hypothetical protein